jgi:hypothetical protein
MFARPSIRRSRTAFFACLLFAAGTLHAQDGKPDVVLTGTLTREDHETYRTLPFLVPSGVDRITIQFSYTGRDQHTTVDLGLIGPDGIRGWSGGNKSSFTVSTSDATSSYLPGPITPGTWKVLLGIPNIRTGVDASYTANIFFSRAPDHQQSAFSPPIKKGPAWYRGDLHMHSGQSDGSCRSQGGRNVPCPVFKILETASARKLDFIALTDHNTVSHFNALRELAPYYDRLLLLHGREITTFQGHLNVYGTDAAIDFRVGSPEVPDLNAVLQQAQKLQAVVSINHASAAFGEECMGCGWNPHPEANLSLVNGVEAINGFHSSITFWEQQLNRGFRLTGIGGSDSHNPQISPPEHGSIGLPTTVVYAAAHSETAILDGIRAGHVFIDLEATQNRMLNFTATAGERKASMGDTIQATPGTEVRFNVDSSGVFGGKVQVIQDGRPLHAQLSPSNNGGQTFSTRSDGQRHWLRINIRSSQGKLLLVGNPIYINF